MNPVSNEPLKVDFLMIHHIPKITIYRIGKYVKGQPGVDLWLKFLNPNMSKATLLFTPLSMD